MNVGNNWANVWPHRVSARLMGTFFRDCCAYATGPEPVFNKTGQFVEASSGIEPE